MKTSTRRRLTVLATVAVALGVTTAALSRTRPTSHGAVPSELGAPAIASTVEALIDQPGPLTVDTVVGADWAVTRAGMINLDDPKAKAAGLTDGDEPIFVGFHAIRHPSRGLFIVDTGTEKALRDDPDHAAFHGPAAHMLGVDKMKFRNITSEWIARESAEGHPLKGVFLTHLHFDHVSGMRDVPNDVPVYTGPGETSETGILNVLAKGPTDAALEGKGSLREWGYAHDAAHMVDGMPAVDVFGDGTLWALHVPGHTAGSTAFLARTTNGPVLLTGDACHTTWGWDNGVEPGTFSADKPRSRASLESLHALVATHPKIEVRVGHQLRVPAVAGR